MSFGTDPSLTRCPRCDRNTPCQRCSGSGTDICHYATDDPTSATSWSRPSQQDTTSRLLSGRPTATNSPHLFTPATSQGSLRRYRHNSPAPSDFLEAPSLTPTNISEAAFLAQRSSEDAGLQNQLTSRPGSSTPTYDANALCRGFFSKGRYFGPSHWMNDVRQVWKRFLYTSL